MIRFDESIGDLLSQVATVETTRTEGRVHQVVGLVIEGTGIDGTIGDNCEIITKGNKIIQAEIVGFRGEKILLMPFDETVGISPGSRIRLRSKPMSIKVGHGLLGRILDGMGNPIDGKGPLYTSEEYPVYNAPPLPLERTRISESMATGIRAIDGLVTLGKGQRVGIFSGSGVGKSVSLGMIARFTEAEVNVIGLIGERGREVKEFIERDLGEEGLKRSVVIVATSDQAAMVRIKAALITTAIAEYFRNQGKDVMLMMDSLTRVAMAQREIGLAVGEPPTTKGYTPSVFALLPRLLERAGTGKVGSITGLYSVLVEGDDMDDPIGDTARSILDGHIVLSRELAQKGHYPAVDVLKSVSRLMTEVARPEQIKQAHKILEMMADYQSNEDLINIGAYAKGSDPKIDEAIKYRPMINSFLQQGITEHVDFESTLKHLATIGKSD